MRVWQTAIAVVLLSVTVGLGQTPAARDGYTTPHLAVPYAYAKPKVDGAINEQEWQGALCVSALQTTDGNISARQTRFWLMWDEGNLYLAMRSPIRPGERVIQANRQADRDNSAVVFDDSYEIWLNANTTSPDGQRVFFQYLGNFAGAHYDVMFEPAVGNSRPGWTSGWKPASRIADLPDGSRAWEMEVAIPRASIYHDTPFVDGEVIHGLWVRNFKRPWEQNSLGGSGSFSVPDTHSQLILSRAAPALQIEINPDATHQTLGLRINGSAQHPVKLNYAVRADGQPDAVGGATVSAQSSQVTAREVPIGKGDVRVQIASEDGKTTYVDWCSHLKMGDVAALTEKVADRGDQLSLSLVFNPVGNFVRVEGDFINYDQRGQIKTFRARVVDASGKEVVTKDLQLDPLAYVRAVLALGDCRPGQYTATLDCLDGHGKVLAQKSAPFTKKDASSFPWWNTKAGDIAKVIAPWTAVKVDGARIGVWGRTMAVGPAGLPGAITSQGEPLTNGAMLVAEMADGSQTSASVPSVGVTSNADYRAQLEARSNLGALDITSQVTCEFDGMYKVQMHLSPRQAMTVKSLKVVIGLSPDAATYYHATGEGIRYGFAYGYVPQQKTGRLWDSTLVDGQPMLVGSFIPFMWVGNDKAGLAWFADSDEGWVPNDQTPAVELRRDSVNSVDLVLNLIGQTFTIDKPRTITFAFQATPVKPLHKGWRMDTWWTGDSFKDWSQLESEGNAGSMGLIFSALPFPLNPAKSRAMADARHQETVHFGIPKYKANAVPYFENVLTTESRERHSPDIAYFQDQWRARVSDALCWDKTSTDYVVWNLDRWCKSSDIDGWYIDNVRPIACDNIDAGRGYRLPDGRVQPTYQIFDTREAFLRIRAMFAENGKSGKFVLHMTNNMVIPWIAAADLALDGEDHVTFPEMNKDFIDFWSPERLRLDYWRPWGVAVTFLQEYQGPWKPEDMKRVMRAYTGMTILHDIHPGANPNGNNPEVWRARDRFGIEADDVTFIGYWDARNPVHTGSGTVRASSWQRPGRALIVFVNCGDAATASAVVDAKALGLTGGVHVVDAETGESIPLGGDGSLKLPVPRHDYRQILLESAN